MLVIKADEAGIKKMKIQQDPGLKIAIFPAKPTFAYLSQFLQQVILFY